MTDLWIRPCFPSLLTTRYVVALAVALACVVNDVIGAFLQHQAATTSVGITAVSSVGTTATTAVGTTASAATPSMIAMRVTTGREHDQQQQHQHTTR